MWTNRALKSNKTLEYLSAVLFETNTHTEELKRLNAGYILEQMLKHFKSKIALNAKPESLWIYSAHDETIVNVLNSLNVFDVRFSSCFLSKF